MGAISVSLEAVIGLPQIISNIKNRSTKGLSYCLILNWIFGDTFKLFYYMHYLQPI